MLVLFWLLLFVVASCLILLMPALWGKQIFDAYRGKRHVNCPETRTAVEVGFDALRAAFTGLSGKPKLRLASCTRWPARANCDQACIPEAAKSLALPVPAPASPQNRIAHLPVLVAAWVIWVLGMVWHSEYVFRGRWMQAMNLSDHATRKLAEMWTPHLLTAAACLLFAYAVATLLLWTGPRTLAKGVATALVLWVVAAAILIISGTLQGARELLWLEGGYTLLGALLAGILIGGLPRRVLVRDSA